MARLVPQLSALDVDSAASRAPKDPSAPNIVLYVLVDDVDAHYKRARSANATIIWDLADQPFGHRMYAAADPEGHEWCFATPLLEHTATT